MSGPGCICSKAHVVSLAAHPSRYVWLHEQRCVLGNERALDDELRSKIAWETQDHHCSGPGYSHKAHGKCSGYTYDRT